MKRVLVIGNGFDLYHGKNTRYSDFLDFLESVYNQSASKVSVDAIRHICSQYSLEFSNSSIIVFVIKQYIDNRNKHNWIDLEADIRDYIHFLLTFINEYNSPKSEKRNSNVPYEFYNDEVPSELWRIMESSPSLFICQTTFMAKPSSVIIDPWGLINKRKVLATLENELNCLSSLLVYYLQTIEPEKRNEHITPQPLFQSLDFDYVISFNYTNTFESIYNSNCEVSYIHGSLTANNIVLGYNDFDNSTDDLMFKKYYRRLIKQTDSVTREGFYSKSMGIDIRPEVHFFGHSLDISDEDYVRDIIDHADKTIIYYIDELDRADKIGNLIKIFGKDKLLKIYNNTVLFKEIPKSK